MLRFAYAFNIAVLLPVVWSLYAHQGQAGLAVFDGKAANVDALRLLVAGLWCSVLICSLLGLWWPETFLPLLVFQVIYKLLYLASFVVPAWRTAGPEAVPLGVTAVFAFVVLVWPLIIAAELRGSGHYA